MAVIPSSKPHIFIIPGAFHPGSVMNLFVKSLEAAGFTAETTTNRSAGNAGITVQDDVVHARSIIIPQIEQGRDIVVIGHSYGGMVGSGVIAGLDKRGREAQGVKGGVIGIICIAGVMSSPDKSDSDTAGPQLAPWIDTSKMETEGVAYTRDQREALYHDVSPELAKNIIATLTSQSALSAQSKPATVGWLDKAYDGRRAYIRCLQDGALPIAMQDGMLAQSGIEWITKSLDASHSPYLSMPDELTRVVEEIIVEFAKN